LKQTTWLLTKFELFSPAFYGATKPPFCIRNIIGNGEIEEIPIQSVFAIKQKSAKEPDYHVFRKKSSVLYVPQFRGSERVPNFMPLFLDQKEFQQAD
jgi:hypothetical protein